MKLSVPLRAGMEHNQTRTGSTGNPCPCCCRSASLLHRESVCTPWPARAIQCLKGELKLASSQHQQHLQRCLRGGLRALGLPVPYPCACLLVYATSPSPRGPFLLCPYVQGIAFPSYSCTSVGCTELHATTAGHMER